VALLSFNISRYQALYPKIPRQTCQHLQCGRAQSQSPGPVTLWMHDRVATSAIQIPREPQGVFGFSLRDAKYVRGHPRKFGGSWRKCSGWRPQTNRGFVQGNPNKSWTTLTRLGARGKCSATLVFEMTETPAIWVAYPEIFRVCVLLGWENGHFGL
jgi:hypothetical protein